MQHIVHTDRLAGISVDKNSTYYSPRLAQFVENVLVDGKIYGVVVTADIKNGNIIKYAEPLTRDPSNRDELKTEIIKGKVTIEWKRAFYYSYFGYSYATCGL